MSFNKFINNNKTLLWCELDIAIDNKAKYNYNDDEIGAKISCLTREKIFRTAIKIMTYIQENKRDVILKIMPQFIKRVKLHVYQLKKLNQINCEENDKYFKDLIKGIYVWIVQRSKMRPLI